MGGVRGARIRVAAFVVAIGSVAIAGALTGGLPNSEEVRDFGESLGWAAVLLWIPVTALLNSMFVPGPILAGAAGLLFGTALGTPLAIAGGVGSALLQMAISRYLAGASVGEILPARVQRIDEFLERRGFWAVLYIRLLPAIPFTVVNYSAGLTKLRFRDMALGTAIGSAPRTFAYVALGGSIGNLGSPESVVAIVLLVVIGLAGLVLGRRQMVAERG
jgi:uncharacterized membrane protein YdjX (TVP38/TMEM64 family)